MQMNETQRAPAPGSWLQRILAFLKSLFGS